LTPTTKSLAHLLDLGEKMLRLRYHQHLINEALKKGAFTIPIHLGFGYEALAVAVNQVGTSEDQLALTHRNAAYNISRAENLDLIVKEYQVTEGGLRGGTAGSMNLTQEKKGIIYTSSILGNNLTVATGMAMAKSHANRPGVIWCVTGDGAIEEGAFWESIIFSATHQLPIIFVIENNDHSMSSTISERRCAIDLQSLSTAINCSYEMLEHNDVENYSARLSAVRDAVQVNRPCIVEVNIKMFNQHHGPTPGWPTDPLNISLSDGLIIENASTDPIYVFHQKVGDADYDKLVASVMAKPSVVE
jgi:TPP-dependent pyruvate/acetoin dehydrogenase alpha subunit